MVSALQLQPHSPQPLPQQAEPSAFACVSQGQHSSAAAPAVAACAVLVAGAPVPQELPVPHDEPLSQQLLELAAFATAASAAFTAAGLGAQPQPSGCSAAYVSQQGLPSALGWFFSQQGVALFVGSQQGDSRRPAAAATAGASAVAVPQFAPGPQPPAPQLESVPQLDPVPQPEPVPQLEPVPQDEAPRASDGTSTTVNESA